MSKLQFFNMRAEEMVQMYDSTFSKREAIKTGKDLVLKAIEEGNVDKEQLLANLSRLKWVLESADTELRSRIEIYEKKTVLGLEFNYQSGGNTTNYSDDAVWRDLKAKLTHREDLIKLALKSEFDFYDEEGVKVEKVSLTPRKSSITIK